MDLPKAEVFKSDIARDYAAQKGISEPEALERITDLLEILSDYVAAGHTVKLHRFINIYPKTTKEFQSFAASTGEPITIPENHSVSIRLTRSLKSRLNPNRK
ncbi:HU family DNA-binding protein [Paenibacillus xylanexedens]|uniref:HU family DNA-binding protein n=1 Tax=Paenibacillus xylanexedens TaxID=528191 RepID=UPI0011A4D76D|nr:HU family DNA-binding protein [Paenibacillus xylanexedens]